MWTLLRIPSPDIVAIQLVGTFGTIRIVNVYNDGTHNNTIKTLLEYLEDPNNRTHVREPLRYIWGADWNRHHPDWEDIERNAHLLTTDATEFAEPLRVLLSMYSMRMVLPRDTPTLQSFATGNYTRVDNVHFSAPLLPHLVRCYTDPQQRPVKTDHFPILTTLELEIPTAKHQPRPKYRETDWGKYRTAIVERLKDLPRPRTYTTTAEVDEAIKGIERAIADTTRALVPESKPPHPWKRWYNKVLDKQRAASARLARDSYRWRLEPDHPVHVEAKEARKAFAKAVNEAKRNTWTKFLLDATGSEVWKVSKFVTGDRGDGGMTRVPTLEKKGPRTRRAETEDGKVDLFRREFYPEPMIVSSVPPNHQYPQPAFEHRSVSNEILREAIAGMAPYKATLPGTPANCVFTECENILVPFLGPVYRALDDLRHYPDGWADIQTIVLRKPGKPDYADPAAYRPIVLSNGLARLYHACKTKQLVRDAELAGILPANQYGARPGRSTTDALHMAVRTVKRAWTADKVASVLCMDVKGAFPSVDLKRLKHDMRDRGVPSEYADLVERRYAKRRSRMAFGDYTSEWYEIGGGLDQGDPLSGILYLLYNSSLAEVPSKRGESAVVFVDDDTLISAADNFQKTHKKMHDMTYRNQGTEHWAVDHNGSFGPAKYQLLDATRKRVKTPNGPKKTAPMPRKDLVLGDNTIRSREAVKLLGLLLDRELRWHHQETALVGKGHAWLSTFARLATATGGLKAASMRRLYLAICVPQMLYGADVFLEPNEPGSKGKREKRVVKQIRTIQRKAALAITGAMPSTPTEVLDAYAALLPVDEMIAKARETAALRLATLPEDHPLQKPFAKPANPTRKQDRDSLHALARMLPHPAKDFETIPAVRSIAKNPPTINTIIAKTRKAAIALEKADRATWRVYTDGSGIDGNIGAAAVLYRGEAEWGSMRTKLGTEKEHTVYEGEAVGCGMALELLRVQDNVEGPVTVVVDNQAAVRAVNATTAKPASWIWDDWHAKFSSLLTKHPNITLTIRWAPGHEDIPGNERADEEAKRAAKGDVTPNEAIPRSYRPPLPISKSAVKQWLNAERKTRVEQGWRKSKRHTRTTQYDNKLRKGSYLALMDHIPRSYAAIILQLRTGHCLLAKHMHRIRRADSPICPCCRQADESVAHYLLHCPAHHQARTMLYAEGRRDTQNITKLLGDARLLRPLMWFIYRTNRFGTVHRQLPIPPDPTKPTRDEIITRLDRLANAVSWDLDETSLPRHAKPFG
uniref:RNA-directed DNA polymerase from transposon X-element n=1 Tax=Mycena chlorophos TaxID=658473 RepID=A0ABQ0LBM2_MYCCL|nr:RNA-directed DNA polymerase from transposon X-element [Mycena chlorophos]